MESGTLGFVTTPTVIPFTDTRLVTRRLSASQTVEGVSGVDSTAHGINDTRVIPGDKTGLSELGTQRCSDLGDGCIDSG